MFLKLSSAPLILLALAAQTIFALDPAMLNLVSPSAAVIAGVDASRVQSSALGQKLMANAMAQVGGNLDKVASATGFDPRRDLQEILVASGNMNQNSGIILARGTFDQQRLTSMARAAGITSTVYKGTTLVQPETQNAGTVAGFVAGYLVAGPRAEVESVIDRVTARTAASALMARAQVASARYDAWLVTAMPADLANALPGGANSPSIPLRGVSNLAAGVRFDADMNIGLEAETRSVQDANSLADVIRLAAALMQPQANNTTASPLASIMNTVNISSEGSVVRATARITATELDQLMKNGTAAPRARRVAQR